MIRKVQSTRPKMVETSVKREKTQMIAYDSRKKSQVANTSGNIAANKTSKIGLEQKTISPRKVISFSMLEDAETNNTKADLRLNKQETEFEGKTQSIAARTGKRGFTSDFGTSEMISTPGSSQPGTRANSYNARKLSQAVGPYVDDKAEMLRLKNQEIDQ